MRFVVFAWAVSRAIVFASIFAAGAHAGALANWDGAWYASIAEHGYGFARDGAQHNVAFFPLYPLAVWPLLRIGIAWPVAAAIVSNACYLVMLLVVFSLARRAFDEGTARWTIALACLLPPSLFCSVAYPQSLFMLLSALALAATLARAQTRASLAGAFASATSGLGIPLAIGMLAGGILQRRRAALVAGIVAFAGVAAFALFCYVRFGDALAFLHAQRAWRHGAGFDASAWLTILRSFGTFDGWRQNAMMLLVPFGLVAVALEARRLGAVCTLYALFALAVLIFSGTPFSVDRNAYAIVPVLIALGALLRRVPPAGYAVLAASALLLAIDSARFARFQWVA